VPAGTEQDRAGAIRSLRRAFTQRGAIASWPNQLVETLRPVLLVQRFHRRGPRFIGAVGPGPDVPSSDQASAAPSSSSTVRGVRPGSGP